jgi:membrane protein implicated in regulation of membrane protease activity
MPAWVWWVVIALVLAAAEIVSVSFFFSMVAIGALAAAVAAALGAPVLVQVLVMAVVAILLIFTLRPLVLRYFRPTPESHTNWRRLIGADALVLQRVDVHGGLVKIGGEEWTARSARAGSSFEPSTSVRVERIEGATAIVDVGGTADLAHEGHDAPPPA